MGSCNQKHEPNSRTMTRNLLGLGLFVGASAATSPISVVCNNDNTIDVAVAYDQKAEVLEFSYGDCDMAKSRANFTQNSDFGFAFRLDVDACNMNDKLRTLEYNQTASMRIGRKSAGAELTLATFQIDSYCTYTSSYKVKFNYGDIKAQAVSYASDAGLINISFALKSYNANYSTEEAHSNKAGETINLGLSITNANFDHADDITNSTSGKVFAPKSCKVVNDNEEEYSLFDSSASCANDDVDFSISYDQDKNMWQFSHILFLLNNDRVSKLSLECDIIVCDGSQSSECDAVVKACASSSGEDEPCVGNCCNKDTWRWEGRDGMDCKFVYDYLVSEYWNVEGDNSWYLSKIENCDRSFFDSNYYDDAFGSWDDHSCPSDFEKMPSCMH